MIIPDINLLLYAVITGFPQHRRAHAWWQDTVNGHTRIGLTYPALFGFLRIATSARVLAAPLPTADAIAYVREWLSQPNVDLLTAGPRHLDIALGLLDKLGTASHLTTDVQLAAYGIEYDAEIHSSDTDFARFADLKGLVAGDAGGRLGLDGRRLRRVLRGAGGLDLLVSGHHQGRQLDDRERLGDRRVLPRPDRQVNRRVG